MSIEKRKRRNKNDIWKLTNIELELAVRQSKNIKEVIKTLGFNSSSRNLGIIFILIVRFKIDYSNLQKNHEFELSETSLPLLIQMYGDGPKKPRPKEDLAKSKSEYYLKYKEKHPNKSKERWKEWSQNNKDFLRDKDLIKEYGITLVQYNSLLKLQNGVCAICKKSETMLLNGKTRSLSVDHDHKTGFIRGLLCNKCNTALGFIQESLTTLETMKYYLTRPLTQHIIRYADTLRVTSGLPQ